MMEPLTLLNIGYQTIQLANVLLSIHEKLSGSQESLLPIEKSLEKIEKLLSVKIYAPLISGLAMLRDAGEEIRFDLQNGRALAKEALSAFNKAEGNLLKDQKNLLMAKVGKAVSYKLLDMKGAFSNTSKEVDELIVEIQQREKIISGMERILKESEEDRKHEDNMRYLDDLYNHHISWNSPH